MTKYMTRAALTALVLALTACTANINATVPDATVNQGGGGGETAKAAVQATVSAPEAKQLDLNDLVAYRLETADASAAARTWVIYYYSPKANKSYRCNQRVGEKLTFVEVTDVKLVYMPGAEIDQTKWQVDSEQAKTAAVQAFTQVNTTVNIASLNVTNMVLLSAAEFTRLTGQASEDPVWQCAVKPTEGTTASPAPSASPTTAPSAEPTAAPSEMPSASPSPTVVTQVTNIYINAKNGSKVNVNTGTQTDTTVKQ